jgi:cytochrome c oxidase subunit 2
MFENVGQSPTTIFAPVSTPAQSIFDLSLFVMAVAAIIFLFVVGLIIYVIVRYRRPQDDTEPPQVYGSNQVELAWTVIPVIIVAVLFLATSRVIAAVQDPPRPAGALDVTVVGHQFWWEFQYPAANVVTANELHVPVSEPGHPTPTFLKLLSADLDHSFWVPRLAGKTDLIPNWVNQMWIDPHDPGLYLGQCAQYCGTQHAKMLLRVYVEPREVFERWLRDQQKPASGGDGAQASEAERRGRVIFETTACINCHTVAGTVANGRFGPDLTHLMSRETIASGIAKNTRENLRRWVESPDSMKPGSKMPPMQLSHPDYDNLVAYLQTLH